jgi:hypothetical protein
LTVSTFETEVVPSNPRARVEQPTPDVARTAVSTLRSPIGGQSGAMPDVQYRPRLRVGGSTAAL